MSATIRLGTADDWEAMCLLNPGLRTKHRGVARMRAALGGGGVVLAEENSAVVGYAAFDYHFFDRCFIEHLIVAPEHRRRGIGSRLVEAVLERCESPDLFTSTNSTNTNMQGLLAGLGFEKCGEVDHLDPGDPEWFYVRHKETT